MLPVEALKEVFAEDKTILITGSKGDGKTNLAGAIKQSLVDILGFDIWTNIHFFKMENVERAKEIGKLKPPKGHVFVPKSEQIHVSKSLSEVLLGIVQKVLEGKVFVLDEAGIHADSSSATSKSTKTIKMINRIIRHFDCCFIIITPSKGNVPPELREKDVDYHFRMKKTRRGYIVEIGKKKVVQDDDGEERIKFPTAVRIFVPYCKYPIDGKFPMGFKIDIDLKDALDKLSEVEDSIEIVDKGKGKQIILNMIKESQDKNKYLTSGQYAKKYGVGTTTVRRWIKDGKVDYYTVPGRGKGDEYRILDEIPRR